MSVGKQQGLFVSEEFAETSQRRGEGLVRLVSVRIGPKDSAQSLFAYVLPPYGDQRLEHLDRLVLGLPGSRNFFTLPYDPEPAERVHLDGPGPVVRLEDRAVRKQVPVSYQLLHVVHLDPFRDGSGGEFLEKAGPPEEQGEKTVPSPDLHPLPQFPQGSRILPFQQEEIGLRQQAREPGMRVVFVTRNPSRLLEVLFRPFRVLKLLAHEGFEDMGLMQGIVAPHAFAQPQTLGRI